MGELEDTRRENTWAFARSHQTTIDGHYVSGLSITYGSNPRHHIWTFACGYSETNQAPSNCPCAVYPGQSPPSYVDDNYYCESVPRYSASSNTYYFNDTLWDGAGCIGGTCCSDTTQPWFYRNLNQDYTR